MQGEIKQRWMELAEQVANEQDPLKFDQLVDELNQLLRGKNERLHPPQESKTLDALTNKLTPREKEILFQMAQGKSNKQIGVLLGLSEGTVKVHMSHIIAKLNVRNRLQAFVVATARGLVSPSGTDAQNSEVA